VSMADVYGPHHLTTHEHGQWSPVGGHGYCVLSTCEHVTHDLHAMIVAYHLPATDAYM